MQLDTHVTIKFSKMAEIFASIFIQSWLDEFCVNYSQLQKFVQANGWRW